MIYILSSGKAAAFKLDKKNTWIEILPLTPQSRWMDGREIHAEDQVYLDISGLSPAVLKKSIVQLKKSVKFWGIIDPKGSADDPALLFFEGAGDYIGPALVKKGLNKKRFSLALSNGIPRDVVNPVDDFAITKRKTQRLPPGKFEGWKSIRAGTEGSFFFLLVSISGKSNLRSMLGEAAFTAMQSRLQDILQQALSGADALLWMETENSNLFLVPSKKNNGMSAIEAALKVILNSQIIAIERLGLSTPVEFTCALHYGQTLFQAPGKTGAVISESINYIFHLGTKKAEPGRLTVSGDVPDEAFPDGLKDLFTSAGVFEGIPVRHSRRFVFR